MAAVRPVVNMMNLGAASGKVSVNCASGTGALNVVGKTTLVSCTVCMFHKWWWDDDSLQFWYVMKLLRWCRSTSRKYFAKVETV